MDDERERFLAAIHLMRDTFLSALEEGGLPWEWQGEFQHQFFDGYAEAKLLWGTLLFKWEVLGRPPGQ